MAMTEEEKREIADLVSTCIEDSRDKYRSYPDPETHSCHHRYVDSLIQRQDKRRELYEKFKSSLVGGIALGILTALYWFGKWILALSDKIR